LHPRGNELVTSCYFPAALFYTRNSIRQTRGKSQDGAGFGFDENKAGNFSLITYIFKYLFTNQHFVIRIWKYCANYNEVKFFIKGVEK